jgi:SAM-dependent methyltransferase
VSWSAARSRIATGLDSVDLLRPVAELRRRYLALRSGGGEPVGSDGLPLPPPMLRTLVDGRSADARRFIEIGAEEAELIRQVAAEGGVELEGAGRVLDFGCGCGRIARHWSGLAGPELHGCDYNPDVVAWCERNLPFMRMAENELDPPSPYESGSFGLIYVLSVLTHLDERRQRAWMEEFRRILRPGGVLVFTTLGEHWKQRLPDSQRQELEAGRVVVERPRRAGSNLCTAYHPVSYVAGTLLPGFELLTRVDPLSPEAVVLQDVYVARRLPDGDGDPGGG